MQLKVQQGNPNEPKMFSMSGFTFLNSKLEVYDSVSISFSSGKIIDCSLTASIANTQMANLEVHGSKISFTKYRTIDTNSFTLSNSIINKSEFMFRELDKVKFINNRFYNLENPLQFSYTSFVSFKSVNVYNSSRFIKANSVYNLELNGLEGINDINLNTGTYISWDSVGTAKITDSNFKSIHSSYFLVVENYVHQLLISNSKFYDVKSIDIHCSVATDFGSSNIQISKTTFDSLEAVRGSVSIRTCTNVLIENSIFKNSRSYAGGALYCSSIHQLNMYNLQFSNNKAIFRPKNIFQSFGSGGAAFINSINTLIGNNITFTNNSGLRGGALYLAHFTINSYNLDIQCFGNNAEFTGGCYHLHLGRLVELEKTKRSKITVTNSSDNKALIYGNQASSSINTADFSYCTVTNIDRNSNDRYIHSGCINTITFKNITRLDTIRLALYPGQVINMTSIFYDIFGANIPFIKTTSVTTNDTDFNYPNIDFKNKGIDQFSHSNVIPYFSVFIKTSSIMETNLLTNSTEYHYYLDADSVVFNVSITLLDCPSLMEMRYDGNGWYICKDRVRYDIILPCSIIGGIFMLLTGFLLGFLFIYSIVLINNRVVKRLKKLQKIEQAENELERNIIEKTFDFSQKDYSDYYDTTFSINNIFSSNKKAVYKSDSKTIPLINEDEEQELSSHESKAMYYSTTRDHNGDYLRLESPTYKSKSSMFIPIENLSIISKIGQGASGVVYKCLLKPNTMVAIKTLVTSSNDGDEAEKMNEEFETEVSLMKSLRHPNIVNFYGVSVSNNTKYMVIEYMEHGSLENVLYKSKSGRITLTLEEKIHILLGVSRGVNYLHSLNPCIIHRDLKPGNILLDRNYNSKISDFGLSRIFQQKSKNLTTNIGTLYYLAPEMFGETSCAVIDNRLDIYSFGIIMWETLFEDIPYTGAKTSKPLSSKGSQYGSYSSNSSASGDLTPFNIPQKVLSGVRPMIPFNNEREFDEYYNEYPFHSKQYNYKTMRAIIFDYIKLMKKCWDKDPKDRPEFSQIIKELQNISSKDIRK
ncbi:predicted protein [Naegleria gruberi]|uniref:non-specific serine/threonine protein kinase n=1 Tax=Naegleria gruberi TaxID=5762 RepID=D2UYN9_NAEGR|nr:uncharacterized protein NAEGRDRAFT_61536 [Naegleria gruberi]EFC50824.1 predicted protein [Naegleria gruberi]|eukprot:XP_002683568.1 predicted protein [Naegleria gruberi strain NEG-M]